MASDKTTVLIVEDEPAIVELVTFRCAKQAGTAVRAKRGEAWDFIQTARRN
jgi:two-component system phosphate regulon response regulator PhoB